VPAAPDVANGTAATLDEAKAKFSDGAVPTGGAPTPRLGQGGQKGALRWDCRRAFTENRSRAPTIAIKIAMP
jgi:hypothetical protein